MVLATDFSLDFFNASLAPSLKISMLIDIIPLFASNLRKSVHIELSNKRGEILMFKVYWKYLLREARYIRNIKSIGSINPLNIRMALLILI